MTAIDAYLRGVYAEAVIRGYHFDASKLGAKTSRAQICVPAGQLRHELQHLKQKLKIRDGASYRKLVAVRKLQAHPLFVVVAGELETWERIA